MNRVINITTSLFQFLPLTVFSFYSFRTGVPSQERLFNGFMIGAVLAVMQLMWLMRQQRPANRLILGANLWLIIGGVAVFLKLWGILNIYRELREAGVLAGMLAIGIVTTPFSRAGYVGSTSGETVLVRRYSYLLLFATAFAVLCGLYFRGNTFLSAVIPILVLVMLHRFLNARLGTVCRRGNAQNME